MMTMNVTAAIRLHRKAKLAVDALDTRTSNDVFEAACVKERATLRLIKRARPRNLHEALQRASYLETYWQEYSEGLCTALQCLAGLQR